jgi:hypothetical protein
MLLRLYHKHGLKQKYLAVLKDAAERSDATPEILGEFGEHLILEGNPDSGIYYIRKAIDLGLDSAKIQTLRGAYPDLLR